jgi:hypothetical protein
LAFKRPQLGANESSDSGVKTSAAWCENMRDSSATPCLESDLEFN